MSPVMAVRRTLATLITAAVILLLAGCDPLPVPDDPASVRVGSDVLEVAVCFDVEVESVYLDYTRADGSSQTLPIEPNRRSLQAGEVIATLTLGDIDPPRLSEGDELYMIITTTANTSRRSSIVLDNEPLDAVWLRSDGSRGDLPCAAAPSSRP